MALVNNNTHGFNIVSSATTFFRQDVVIGVDPPLSVASREMAILGTPRLTVWAYQSVGIVAGSFSVQFSIADNGGVKEWLDLTPPLASPLGVPVLAQFTIPAKFIRILSSRPAGQATTIQFAMMAAM